MSHFTGKFATNVLAAGAAILFVGTALAAPSTSVTTKAAKPAVAPSGTILIGNFEGPIIHNKNGGSSLPSRGQEFGWGWAVSTDQIMGGHSTAKLSLVHPGAKGTPSALKITGDLKAGSYPWAGAFWFAGREFMQPVNLSNKIELLFWAKGTPGQYKIMLRSGSTPIPQSTSFTVTSKWKQYHVSLKKSFPGADWANVIFMGFSAGKQGKFVLELDQVSLR